MPDYLGIANLDSIPFQSLSMDQNQSLIANFDEKEVKEVKKAIWECKGSKALRPDGFNFKFIKELWDLMKEDIMWCVREFHQNGCLPRGTCQRFIHMTYPKS